MCNYHYHPIIGLKSIHERYFVSAAGEEIISFSAFKKLSSEMQEAGACLRFELMIKGRKKVRIVAIEPFFSLWMRLKWGPKREKIEVKSLVL